MQTIKASFEIVTPMFIGGGNSDEVELRPPSIKGALRFWWRALHWGQCLQESEQNVGAALKLLHDREAKLFGAAAKDKTERGQSPFFIKLIVNQNYDIETQWPTNNVGAGYIGYGLDATSRTNQPHRLAIKPVDKENKPLQFSLHLVLKNTITPDQIKELKLTLRAWGLLGGLGSRGRRGFGSVNLKKLINSDDKVEEFNFPDLQAYTNAVTSLITNPPIKLAPSMPIFTAFNDSMQIAVIGNNGNYKKYRPLMDDMGNQYKTARKTVNGLKRAVFGLPLEGLTGQKDTEKRRSSPLFLHIHKLTTSYIGVFSFIPAEFHHDSKYSAGKELDFYKTIQNYMDAMKRVYP